MKVKKVAVSLGNDELKKRIASIPEIEIIEEDDDIDILTDILDMVKVDMVILNILLSYDKAVNLAIKAQKLGIRIIVLVGDKKSLKNEIGALAALGVNVFLSMDEIYLIPAYIENYPNKFDFSTLGEGKNSGKNAESEGILGFKKSIAFLGIMPRIGTTTQAITLLNQLKALGHKGIYIENNKSGYIKLLQETYSGALEKESGIISYSGMDFLAYDKLNNIRNVLDMDYSFYIYDYGDVSKADFSWREKDFVITVCGTKPNELTAFSESIKELISYSPKFIFSFTSEEERRDVKEQMDIYKDDTYFSEYNPDPYISGTKTAGKYFEEMLGLIPKKDEVVKKKMSILGRKL